MKDRTIALAACITVLSYCCKKSNPIPAYFISIIYAVAITLAEPLHTSSVQWYLKHQQFHTGYQLPKAYQYKTGQGAHQQNSIQRFPPPILLIPEPKLFFWLKKVYRKRLWGKKYYLLGKFDKINFTLIVFNGLMCIYCAVILPLKNQSVTSFLFIEH